MRFVILLILPDGTPQGNPALLERSDMPGKAMVFDSELDAEEYALQASLLKKCAYEVVPVRVG